MSLNDINNTPDFPNLLKTYPLEEAYKYRAFTRINVEHENIKIKKWVEIDFPRLLKDTVKIDIDNCFYLYILTVDEINNGLYDTFLSYYYKKIFNPKTIKMMLLYANNKIQSESCSDEEEYKSYKKDTYFLSRILDKSILKYPNINPDEPFNNIKINEMYNIFMEDICYCYKHIKLFDAIEGNINEYNKFKISKISENDYQRLIQYWLYNELVNYINDNVKSFDDINDYNIDGWLKLSENMKNWSKIFEEKYNESKNIN